MSIYPCEVHKRRVPGSLESVRLTVLRGSDRHTRRMRLCAEHLNELESELDWRWESISNIDDGEADPVCRSCRKLNRTNIGDGALFGWLYRRGLDPKEVYGSICEACSIAVINAYSLTQES